MLLNELAMTAGSYRPTETERVVLAKIIVSTTPQLAYDEVARGIKLNTAKEKLVQLGFVTVLDGEIELTGVGEELAKAQALMDEMGEPSEDAREVAATPVD